MLNSRAMNKVMEQVVLWVWQDMLPVAMIHDAYYLMYEMTLKSLKQKHLAVEQAYWNDHPDIYVQR